MSIRISDTVMSSDVTRRTAAVLPGVTVEGGPTAWSVTWLPGRALTRNQAVTAMTLAEAVVTHADDLMDRKSRWWLHIDQWAAELGLTGPRAVAEASLPPSGRPELTATAAKALDAMAVEGAHDTAAASVLGEGVYQRGFKATDTRDLGALGGAR